jgi:hypothetical protein
VVVLADDPVVVAAVVAGGIVRAVPGLGRTGRAGDEDAGEGE